MVQVAKHLGLIITLLAWVVFPLPECYLTNPQCPLRNHIAACNAINHQRSPVQERGSHACCGSAQNHSGHADGVRARASHQDGRRMAVASLSPRFLLPDLPVLPGPAISFNLVSPISAAPAVTAVFCSPYRGERTDPIPILQQTQTLLI